MCAMVLCQVRRRRVDLPSLGRMWNPFTREQPRHTANMMPVRPSLRTGESTCKKEDNCRVASHQAPPHTHRALGGCQEPKAEYLLCTRWKLRLRRVPLRAWVDLREGAHLVRVVHGSRRHGVAVKAKVVLAGRGGTLTPKFTRVSVVLLKTLHLVHHELNVRPDKASALYLAVVQRRDSRHSDQALGPRLLAAVVS